MSATETFKPGDVIEDVYGNPSVVLRVNANGKPIDAMQTVGSDRGQRGWRAIGSSLRRITDEVRAEHAREVARSEWRAGRRW